MIPPLLTDKSYHMSGKLSSPQTANWPGHEKGSRITGCLRGCKLLFNDFQDFHGASLYADAASNALGSGILGLQDHDLQGADLDALAAGYALLLVDHVHTSLGILSNSLMLTNLGALATLDADHRLCTGTLGNDLDAGQIRVELFIESIGAGTDALQTGHAVYALFNCEFLHNRKFPFISFYDKLIIQGKCQNGNGEFSLSSNFSVFPRF